MGIFKRSAAAALALVLGLGVLSACGDTTDPSAGATAAPEFIYVAGYTPLGDAGVESIQRCVWSGGKLYMMANIKDGTATESYPTSATDIDGKPIMETYEYDVYRTALLSANEDGTNLTELEGYTPLAIPEGMEGSSYVQGMAAGGNGSLWLLENLYTYSYDLPDDFDETVQNKWDYYVGGEEAYYIRLLDETGAEQVSLDAGFLKGDREYFYVNAFTVDGSGNLYLTDGDGNLFVLDGTGSLLFKIEAAEGAWINSMVALGDGRVAVLTYDDTGTSVLKPVDLATKGYGESAAAPFNAWNLYPGAGEYDFYFDTGTSFFGYDMETETTEKLLTWINSDVDSNYLSSITPLPDGRIIAFSSDYSGETVKNEIVTMTKTPYSESAQKTTLTYACMYLDWNLRSQIIKFNKTNPDYRIEVQDYSEYNTNDDYTAGLTKLTTEIISGKVPDILSTDSLPISQYAAKGMLEDLWTYIDADTEIGGRDGLMTPVFKALEQDGKLYQVSSSFMVYTVVGAPSIVGAEPGWTLDDLYAALEKMPEGAEVFSMGTTKDSILSQCCALGMDSFVNWSTGECSFDSPDFIKILEFTKLFPAEFDWEKIDWEAGDYEDDSTRIMNGKQMLAQFYASDFQYFQMYKAMFGGEVTFIGYPTESGDGNAFQMYGGLAMSSKCANKDGAWQFIRTLLTEDYQRENSWDFPTNRTVFDEKLKTAMTPVYTTDPETGEQVEQSQGSWGWGDLTVEIYALTQAEADQITGLINSTTRVYAYDENLMKIINEEAEAFFAGQKSAEDTAAMIQSRVSLYVNEQR